MKIPKGKSYNFTICSEADVISASYASKLFAKEIGFNVTMQTMIATAISELASNIVKYAYRGRITIGYINQMGQQGIEVIAEDSGPGIPDRVSALTENFSTGKTLGLGLPSVKNMMDEFMMDSFHGLGTKIVARKWVP